MLIAIRQKFAFAKDAGRKKKMGEFDELEDEFMPSVKRDGWVPNPKKDPRQKKRKLSRETRAKKLALRIEKIRKDNDIGRGRSKSIEGSSEASLPREDATASE